MGFQKIDSFLISSTLIFHSYINQYCSQINEEFHSESGSTEFPLDGRNMKDKNICILFMLIFT